MTSQSKQGWDDAVHDAASDWWSRMRGPEAEQGRAEFERWLAADASHRVAYSQLQDNWILSEGLDDTAMGQNRSLERARSPFRASGPKVAAVVAAAAAVAFVMDLLPAGRAPAPASQQFATLLQTAVGEVRTVDLPDGSELTLDTDSRVHVHFAGGARRVELVRGRARFDVRANPAQAFIVEAGDSQIIAPEGYFDAALLPQGVCLWARNGTLDVRAGVPQMRPAVLFKLKPGQTAVLAPGTQTAPEPFISDKASEQWIAGMLVFKSVPLSDVLAQTNRYSRQQILLADTSLGNRRVTGTFRPLPVNALAASLAAAFGLQVRAETNGNLALLPK
ncbi:FecR family protein [Sphingomonas sp. PB4P5]|uniref:FecR family protein n=1 Tax=Parasphingomonas puruogangriensis TaxID=3096155 RepID=UPI002FC98005